MAASQSITYGPGAYGVVSDGRFRIPPACRYFTHRAIPYRDGRCAACNRPIDDPAAGHGYRPRPTTGLAVDPEAAIRAFLVR